MTLDLINNVALLLAVCWIQSLISYRWNKESLKAQALSGILFAVATVTVMMVSILVQPGLWYLVDSSMVVISVATLLYGPIAGGIALLVGIAYRLWMGGLMATAGTLGILIAFAAGLAYRLAMARGLVNVRALSLLLFGLLINGVVALAINSWLTPVDITESPAYVFNLLIIMAAATVLLGLQLQYIERKKALEREIKANEERLQSIAESIPDQLIVADTKGVLLDVITPAELAAQGDKLIGRNLAALDPEAFHNHYSLLLAGSMVSDGGAREIYAANQKHLLDTRAADTRHFFESHARRMVSELEGDKVIILTRDITERKQAEERIRFLAHYDPMTRLPNRHLARDTVEKTIVRANYANSGFVVAMLHLDELYIVNQTIGSAAGDYMVKEVAARLTDAVAGGFVSRYSGADFLIISESLENDDAIRNWGNRLLAAVRPTLHFETHEIRVRASLGIARYPMDGGDANLLIRRCVVANQHAQESLERKCQLYVEELETALTDYIRLRDRLAKALEEDEFELYYQPYLSLHDGSIQGVEAFLRWNNPELGLKAPDYFLETAEKSGLIVSIGDWILQQAALQVKTWRESGVHFGTLAINISSAQLTQGNLVQKIRDITRVLGIPANTLALEITESSVNRDMNQTTGMTKELRAMGVSLSIDDFGTGFSNIQYLRKLSVNNLKIDQEFTRDMENDDNKRDIVKAIIQIAQAMGMNTIAEGVENRQVEDMLLAMGCTHAQGYHYCKPLPAIEAAHFIRERTPAG